MKKIQFIFQRKSMILPLVAVTDILLGAKCRSLFYSFLPVYSPYSLVFVLCSHITLT